MIKRVILSLSVLSLLSCFPEPLQLQQQMVSEAALTECQQVACPDVEVKYVEVVGTGEVAEKINSTLNQSVINALFLGGSQKTPDSKTIIEAIEKFIAEYRLEDAEYPGMSAAYFAEITQSVSISNSSILSISEYQILYTGGAHGSSYVKFINFDPNTGEQRSIASLFSDLDEVNNLAEDYFRNTYEISKNTSINSKGHSFKDDHFHLPKAIGFTSTHLVLYYNDYEIASYVEGPSEVKIPIEEVIPYLSFSWEQE